MKQMRKSAQYLNKIFQLEILISVTFILYLEIFMILIFTLVESYLPNVTMEKL